MPYREYLCDYCGHQFEELSYSKDPEEYALTDCRCGSKAKVLPALIGGYHGNMGGSSSRPKNTLRRMLATFFPKR